MAPANDNGCRFGHNCRRRASNYIKTREVNIIIVISTIINGLLGYFFIPNLAQHHGRLARTLDRVDPPTPRRWRGERLRHHGRCVFGSCRGVVAVRVGFGTKKT